MDAIIDSLSMMLDGMSTTLAKMAAKHAEPQGIAAGRLLELSIGCRQASDVLRGAVVRAVRM